MSILSLIFFGISIFGINQPIPSENVLSGFCELEVSVKSTEIGGDYKVEVIVKDSIGTFEYFFFDNDRNLINVNSDDNEILIKERGEYFCVVVQDKKCHKKIDFEL